MPRRRLFYAGRAAIVCLWLTTACRRTHTAGTPAVVPKGSRHLGLHLSTAADGDYAKAYAHARTAGIDCVPFTLQWTALEKDGRYDSAGLLAALSGFYSGQPVSLSVCLSPFAADRRDMPADLSALAFDDPRVISRFGRLLDTLHARLAGTPVIYLLLGNECDLYLAGHMAEWPAYTRFCTAAAVHAKSLWGDGLKTGAETTLGAATGSLKTEVRRLQDSMDLLCLTYYPLKPDFFMEVSSQTDSDLATLFALYPVKPVLFQEVGYASGNACGGSDTAQLNFVKAVFRQWDRRPEQMAFVAFLWLNDLSSAAAEQVTADYGLKGTPAAPAFTEYIRTLGLCDQNGIAKPAFTSLQKEAARRGWVN